MTLPTVVENLGAGKRRDPFHDTGSSPLTENNGRESTTTSWSPIGHGKVIMEFSGKELVRGEPDASSFPPAACVATSGQRYTAWDPTSFAFIKDGSLAIPTVFCLLFRRSTG